MNIEALRDPIPFRVLQQHGRSPSPPPPNPVRLATNFLSTFTIVKVSLTHTEIPSRFATKANSFALTAKMFRPPALTVKYYVIAKKPPPPTQ